MMSGAWRPVFPILEAVNVNAVVRPLLPMVLSLFLFPSIAAAADKDGNYAVWGVGAKSCFHYTQAQAEAGAEAAAYRNYVTGYLTAFDAITEDTYSISAGKDLDQVMAWMTEYCTKKQIHSFEQALAEFTVEQHPQRSRRPPFRFGR